MDCRALAKGARTQVDASMLEDIAADLEDEADKLDAQQATENVARAKPEKLD